MVNAPDSPPSVALRPLHESDLALFETAYESRDGAGEHQWFGLSPPGRGLAELGAIGADGGRLTVVDGEAAVGSVSWYRRVFGLPQTSWCWEIGVHILPRARGRGIGTRSQRLLVDYLFANTLAWRIQAMTDIENLPEQRALRRIGFRREGVLRDAQWREGSWHDQVLYALLRRDRELDPA
ncbi:GNAT family protein [Streptomyces sp. NPDC046915]|uniref:GNAT family N-acetyltransferase n=1 Tax=Streptomyces sp. NPDC046915 TaxID=3155257 RepID=UPI00340C2C32